MAGDVGHPEHKWSDEYNCPGAECAPIPAVQHVGGQQDRTPEQVSGLGETGDTDYRSGASVVATFQGQNAEAEEYEARCVR